MGRHTPGPWKLMPSNHGPEHFAIYAGHECIASTSAGTCNGSANSANANLISAAPDLREACIEAATTLANVIDKKRLNGEKCEEEKTVLDLIVIALTKARGELK